MPLKITIYPENTGEKRTSLVIEDIQKLVSAGNIVYFLTKVIEQQSRQNNYTNIYQKYINAGAKPVTRIPMDTDYIVMFKAPILENDINYLVKQIPQKTSVIGYLNPNIKDGFYQKMLEKKPENILYPLEKTNLYEAKYNALPTISYYAGYDACRYHQQKIAHIMIIGSGNAARGSLRYAINHNMKCTIITTNDNLKKMYTQVNGGEYIKVTKDKIELEIIEQKIIEHQPDMIIATARIKDQDIPYLISVQCLQNVRHDIILHDLAASLKANIESAKFNQTKQSKTNDGHVITITNISNYPSKYSATECSVAFSKCLTNILLGIQQNIDPIVNLEIAHYATLPTKHITARL